MSALLSFWSIDWFSLALLTGLALLYGYAARWQRQPGVGWYVAGLVVVGLVQTSPLYVLGAHYLLSAHMMGHMLLLLIAAPLLVLGLPKQSSGKGGFLVKKLSVFFVRRPWMGWLLGVGIMWFWHIPSVYDATVAHDYSTALGDIASIPICRGGGSSAGMLANLAHILHPISLLLAGGCFAWPLIGPFPEQRIHPMVGIAYLASACLGCSLMGMLITFAPVGVYQTYVGADYYGLLRQIHEDWGFDRATDQQTAGLLMWVPGCLIYLTGALYLFTNWLTVADKPVGPLLWNEEK
ncbi:cytochrome c oxidase assembly protein [Spirosoma sp. KUDC1026]|uniref:cytochrome c oxidase assembly protein n=1 Tax=Spirosoma sp. KUDC1026 TaxID=2745947 RepID=UPI00159B91E9|nr:cytochrome c oxidase assembly protein [Spirosoma sp. KUDC1026]QKZ13244.1 cytochrome c oxidase assembly protein [Spirosoma sp. KUDC1026]